MTTQPKHTKELSEKIENILRKQQDESVVWLSDEIGEIVNELLDLFTSREEELIEEIEKDFNKYVRGSYDHPFGNMGAKRTPRSVKASCDRLFSQLIRSKRRQCLVLMCSLPSLGVRR